MNEWIKFKKWMEYINNPLRHDPVQMARAEQIILKNNLKKIKVY